MFSEWISILVNIALTVVTAFMAYETYKMAKSTNTSVDEMKINRKETNSAEVMLYFKVEGHRIYLIIENFGNTSAKNVKITYVPELKNSKGYTYEKLNNIDFLPPHYQIKTFFDMVNQYYGKYDEDPNLDVKLSFENMYGETVERKYRLDLGYLKSVRQLNSEMNSAEMSLHNIYKELKKYNENN